MLTNRINTGEVVQDTNIGHSEVRDYIELLKPRVMSLAIFTAIVGMLLVTTLPNPVLAIFSIIAIGKESSTSIWNMKIQSEYSIWSF